MAAAKTLTALEKSNEEARRAMGREVLVLSANCGLPVGTKFRVGTAVGYTDYINVINSATGGSYNLYPGQYKLKSVTANELTEEKSEKEKEIKEINRRLGFLEETGTSEYDETEFKVYNILQELKENDSDIGRAKAIAKLIS